MTTCQIKRLPLLTLLWARNGNEVMTTMIAHNRYRHTDTDTLLQEPEPAGSQSPELASRTATHSFKGPM